MLFLYILSLNVLNVVWYRLIMLYVIYYYWWNYIIYIIFVYMYFVVRIFFLNDKCILNDVVLIFEIKFDKKFKKKNVWMLDFWRKEKVIINGSYLKWNFVVVYKM